MPKAFPNWNGYRFHFYSNEGEPREPVHVHVTKDRATAKFWLNPVSVEYNKGFRCESAFATCLCYRGSDGRD